MLVISQVSGEQIDKTAPAVIHCVSPSVISPPPPLES
jgi:hypothetical protein